MTLADAQAHAAHHGHTLEGFAAGGIAAQKAADAATGLTARLPKPVRMTRPEKEYGMILEAEKRRGEIVDYRFQGMSLAWGVDPKTGIAMRYKCDWLVIYSALEMLDRIMTAQGDEGNALPVKVIEVKGSHIWERDLVRFKGCRAEWPMFQFEMHQLKAGEWRRLE